MRCTHSMTARAPLKPTSPVEMGNFFRWKWYSTLLKPQAVHGLILMLHRELVWVILAQL